MEVGELASYHRRARERGCNSAASAVAGDEDDAHLDPFESIHEEIQKQTI